MQEALLGNRTVEKVLFFLHTYEKGYPKRMADVFHLSLNGIQQQLKRLEEGGVVVSELAGRTRIYQFNPRYPFLKEIKSLLEKAFTFLPEKELTEYYRLRTRPRRPGKPL